MSMKSNNIISTKVSLSRNLNGHMFPHKLGEKEGKNLTQSIFLAIKNLGGYSTFDFSSINDEVEVEYLAKHYITLELINNSNFSGFAFGKDGNDRIYVNADNHIEIVRVNDTLNLQEDFDKVNSIDDELSSNLDYAYDTNLGYLTCDLSLIGTGLKIYVDMFLPAITNLNKTSSVSNMLTKLGVSILDVSQEYGMDGVYRISNTITLGKKEEQIVSIVDNVTKKLLDIEKDAMDEYLRKYKLDDVKNMVYRAYGTLKNSHLITKLECSTCLSRVKFGINMGLISFDNEIDFSKILIDTNEEVLLSKLKTSDDKAVAINRADYLAKNLENIKR